MNYLTTNWTEKMKSNPVANKILNKKKRKYYHMIIYPFTGQNDLNEDDKFDTGFLLETNRGWFNEKGRDNMRFSEKFKSKAEIENMDLTNVPNEYDDEEDHKLVYINNEKEEIHRQKYFAHTYVNDYINIHHPKERICYVSALSSKPLSIKPPSVFFSDV